MTATVPTVPGYRLGRVLGRGGTATVWSATRARDGLTCAVKVLAPGRDLRQAEAEARVLATVDDPHVLGLLEAVPVTWGGTETLALVTELLVGGSLERAVRQRGTLSPGEVSTVLVPLAQSLARVHAIGIVHGDVSPGNVLLTGEGRPVLTDLGAAAIAGERPEVVFGTEGFVAPEVLDGGRPLPASDVYSLAALAWFALAGAVPDVTLTRGRLLDHAPATPAAVAELVEACLVVDPGQRPEATDLAADLHAAAPPEPVNLVPGADAAAALTIRLRAESAGDESPARPRTPRWRRALARARRHGSRHAVPALVLTGAGLLVAGTAGWTWADGPTAEKPAPANPSHAVSQTALAAASRPTRPAAHATRPVQTTRATHAPATASPPAVPRHEASDVLRDPGAPGGRAPALLEALLRRRAAAWSSGDRAALTSAEAPGSPAMTEDDTALARARTGGVVLSGVGFRARSVSGSAPAGGVATLSAEVSRSACTAVTSAGTSRVPAEPWRWVRITLTWTGDGWRLRSWSPTPGSPRG